MVDGQQHVKVLVHTLPHRVTTMTGKQTVFYRPVMLICGNSTGGDFKCLNSIPSLKSDV